MITRYNSSLRWTYRNLLKIELAVIRTPFTTARSGELNFWISSGSKLSHLSGKSTVAIRLIVSDICAWIWGGTVHINSTRWFLTVTRSWAEMTIPFLSSSYVQLWYKKKSVRTLNYALRGQENLGFYLRLLLHPTRSWRDFWSGRRQLVVRRHLLHQSSQSGEGPQENGLGSSKLHSSAPQLRVEERDNMKFSYKAGTSETYCHDNAPKLGTNLFNLIWIVLTFLSDFGMMRQCACDYFTKLCHCNRYVFCCVSTKPISRRNGNASTCCRPRNSNDMETKWPLLLGYDGNVAIGGPLTGFFQSSEQRRRARTGYYR